MCRGSFRVVWAETCRTTFLLLYIAIGDVRQREAFATMLLIEML